MMNQVVLVGRLAKKMQDEYLWIIIPRQCKNEDGEYEKDTIKCVVKDTMIENINNYCKVGDIIAIKGRMESNNNSQDIIVEKITFLAQKTEK